MGRSGKRYIWLTDIHLNHLAELQVQEFVVNLKMAKPDGLLIGGDVGDAESVLSYLEFLADVLRCPIYFVLGNHDYYGGTIENVRKNVEDGLKAGDLLHWLPKNGPVKLSVSTGLVGVGGWGDGMVGDFWRSNVRLNDFKRIGNFVGITHNRVLVKESLRALGMEASKILAGSLGQAVAEYSEIIVLTHVPPFREATWHEGRVADDNWLPFFTCGAVGEVLRDVAITNPNKFLTVLCGHTHGEGFCQILPNLKVYTGGACYGKPAVQRVLLF